MYTSNGNLAFLFQKILYVGTIFIPIYFVDFSLLLTGERKKANKILKLNLAFAFLFLISLFFTPFFIEHVKERTFFGYWPVEVGILYYLFLIWFGVTVIYGFISLWRGYKNQKLSLSKRKQIQYIFWGVLIGFLAGSLNFLLDFNINIPPFYNLFVPFYLGFTGYAIVTGQLFGIKIILTDFLIWIMGLILFFEIFVFESLQMKLISIATFLLFCFFGYYLIKATHEEERRREEAERLAHFQMRLAEEAQIIAIRAEAMRRSQAEFAQRMREIAERERKLRL